MRNAEELSIFFAFSCTIGEIYLHIYEAKLHKAVNLTDAEIKSILKTPLYGAFIAEAVQDQLDMDCYANGTNRDRVLSIYKTMMPAEMATIISNHFGIHSKAFLAKETGTVYSHFDKINNTQEGKAIRLSFDDSYDVADYVAYIKRCFMASPGRLNGISDFEFFGHQAIVDAVYAPNTRYVIDMPAENAGNEIGGAMPYQVRVPIETIHDLYETDRGVEYMVVKQRWGKLLGRTESQYIENEALLKSATKDMETRYFVYASDYLSVWSERDAVRNTYTLISKTENPFGCVPVVAASSFNKHGDENYVVKKSPITDSMSDLFWYNLMANMHAFFKSENMIPKTVQVAAECDETHPETGESCGGIGSFLISAKDADGHPRLNNDGSAVMVRTACRKCEQRKREQYTFGKRIQINYIDWKANPQMVANLDKSFGYIVAPDGSLKYNDATIDALKNKIISDITGEIFNKEGSKEDFTEAYLSLATDDRQNNLSRFASHIEELHTKINTIIARVRYPSFISLAVNYGRTYFFKSTETLINELAKLTEKTGDVCLVLDKATEVARSRYRQDPAQFELYQVLNACIPYSELPLEKVLAHKDAIAGEPSGKMNWYIRTNATMLVREFLLTDATKILAADKTAKYKIRYVRRWLERRIMQLFDISDEATPPAVPAQAKQFVYKTPKTQ